MAQGEQQTLDADDLEAMQKLVGGYIETVAVAKLPGASAFDRGLIVVCNEEGALMRLPPNRLGLVGTFIVARTTAEDFAGLSAEDVAAVRGLMDVALS